MAEKPPTKCSTCGKAAPRKCSQCKVAKYCSTECQTKDWPKHKKVCCRELEMVLERLAEIVQQAYLRFREETWDVKIAKVEIKPGKVITYDSPTTPELFSKFPSHLMPNTSVKQGVLCHLMCQDAFAFMHQLISELLQGWPVEMSEARLIMKNVPRTSTAVFPNGQRQRNWPGQFHHVLQLKQTKGRKTWYLDITGAQYGLHRTMWVARNFNSAYVEKVDRIRAFGTDRAFVKSLATEQGDRSALHFRKCFEAATHMNEAVDNWTERKDMQLASLVMLEGQAFEANKTELLEVITLAVRDYITDTDFSEEMGPIRLQEAPENQAPLVRYAFI